MNSQRRSESGDRVEPREVPGWLAQLAPHSEMARLVAEHDWASTGLGPADSWPAELRTAVQTCLATRFPMLVVWGPEMLKIYNDGYRPILGEEKHPAALGAPVREVWAEIWDRLEPLFDQVFSTGEPTWDEDQQLIIERNGYPEECFFTWSYSPVVDDGGNIAGVIDIVTETTAAVISRRRLGCLADVSAELSTYADLSDVCLRASHAMARWRPSITSSAIYLRVEDHLTLVVADDRVARLQLPLDIAATGSEVGRSPRDEVILSLEDDRGERLGLLVLGLNPQRPYDESYREFTTLLAGVVARTLAHARAQAAEVDQLRLIGDTLQQAMLEPASDFVTVAARYRPATGNLSVGGDWYDVIELPGDRRALVVGDCVGHGLEAAAAMSQLRAAMRAMLLQGRGPAEVLDALDLFAGSVTGAYCATTACAVIDRADGSITYSRAGHLPPLVVSPNGAVWLDEVIHPPLGIDPGRPHTEGSYRLTGDDLLILYSDGLVERRGETVLDGLERLASAASSLTRASVQDVADGLMTALLEERPRDDTVLVVKRIPPRAVDDRPRVDARR